MNHWWFPSIIVFIVAVVWTGVLYSPPAQPEKPPTFSPPPRAEEPVVFSKRYRSGELRVYEVAPTCYLAVLETPSNEGKMSLDPDSLDASSFSLACAR